MSTGNFLLDGLSHQDLERLQRHLKPVRLERGDYVYTARRRVLQTYFPVDAVISVVGMTEDGQVVEGGLAGREGLLGLPVVLGDGITLHHSIVQIGGTALRIQAPLLKATFDWSGTFRDATLRYAQYFISQLTQTAVCNRTHVLEARLARWLLTARDAAGTNHLELTHETLAQMLGVHRPGVSIAIGALKEMGVIDCGRGRISLRNLARLREMSCPCYSFVRWERDRLLGLVKSPVT